MGIVMELSAAVAHSGRRAAWIQAARVSSSSRMPGGRWSFLNASAQRGAGFWAWLHQQSVRFGPTFDGPWFHPVGPIADAVIFHVAQVDCDQPSAVASSHSRMACQEAAIFCRAAVKLSCRGERSEVRAASSMVWRIKL